MKTCQECQESFEQIGTHWRWNPEHRPSFSDHQHEVLTGIVMGDACVNDNGGNPCIKMSVIQREYLEELDDIFSEVSRGVEIDRLAGDVAEMNRQSGFSPEAKEENYHDVYMWHTVNHPELQQYRDWYASGKKEWPKDLEITPTVLKHLYACDGTLSHGHVQISMSNELENFQFWVSKFNELDMYPTKHSFERPEHLSGKSAYLYFPTDSSERFFDYVGSPVNGFEYKWP